MGLARVVGVKWCVNTVNSIFFHPLVTSHGERVNPSPGCSNEVVGYIFLLIWLLLFFLNLITIFERAKLYTNIVILICRVLSETNNMTRLHRGYYSTYKVGTRYVPDITRWPKYMRVQITYFSGQRVGCIVGRR